MHAMKLLKKLIDYIYVRRATYTKIIFFNGRRPAEITNMKVSQWTVAKQHFYLTESQKRSILKENIIMDDRQNF